MAKSNFIVRGGADFSGIQQEISKTEKSLKGFESRINSTFKGISEGLGINLGKLTKVGLFAARLDPPLLENFCVELSLL